MTDDKKPSSLLFLLLLLAAFFLAYVPYLNWPLSWMQTFFHEISHGIAALVTGGSIVSIKLRFDGSGLCTTIGGSNFVITISGYLGAVAWGMGVYLMADKLDKNYANTMALFIAITVLLSAVFFGRDMITLIIMNILTLLLFIVTRVQSNHLIKMALKFVGIFILLDAIKAPLNLLDGRNFGDGASLFEMSGIPEFVWVVLWFVAGLYGLYTLWKVTYQETK